MNLLEKELGQMSNLEVYGLSRFVRDITDFNDKTGVQSYQQLFENVLSYLHDEIKDTRNHIEKMERFESNTEKMKISYMTKLATLENVAHDIKTILSYS